MGRSMGRSGRAVSPTRVVGMSFYRNDEFVQRKITFFLTMDFNMGTASESLFILGVDRTRLILLAGNATPIKRR